MTDNDFDLHVFITHFVPPKVTLFETLADIVSPRFSFEYLRSWARLLKHGTRGFQPWKKDILTNPRKRAQRERESKLAEVIRAVELIQAFSVNINIYTNSDLQMSGTSKNSNIRVIRNSNFNKMNTQNNSPWTDDFENSPWNLLWEHKKDLKLLAQQKSRRKRIFLVLENDVLFTQQNLNYWLKNRETLRHSRLVPSFLRIEYSQNLGDWICIDIHGMNSLKERILRKIADNLVLQIPSLYSGLIVLDDELLVEYVESKAIDKLQSKELIWWDLGARASMGIQFVNIPQNFSDRHVIPLYQPLNLEVPKEALVHHLPNLYSSVPELANRYPTLDRVNRQLET